MNTVFTTRQPRDWWNTVGLGVVAVIAFLIIGFTVWSSGSTGGHKTNKSAASTTPASVKAAVTTDQGAPPSLANAGEYGENVYDYAKVSDWKNSNVKLVALKDAVKNVRAEVSNKGAAVDRLDGYVAALDRAVTARDRQSAMREANQVTLDVADMTAAYKLSVPVEVTRLDYYGRELEVWAEAQDASKLRATAREMEKTWNSLRPSVAAYDATEAKKFDALVAQVKSARTPADYAGVATPVLDQVDKLEGVF